MQRMALLVRAEHFEWTGLRSTLQDRPGTWAVEEATGAEQAVQRAQKLAPDVIIVAAVVEDVPADALVWALRRASPGSKIIVLGTESEMRVAPTEVEGHLTWDTLTPVVLDRCLAAVVEADLYVGSPAAIRALRDTANRCLRPRVSAPALTDVEVAVLRHLAAGLRTKRIAAIEHMGERDVKRHIAALEKKFDAGTPFVLGMKAGCQGHAP